MAKNNSNNLIMWPVVIALIIGFFGGFFVARIKYKLQIKIISTMYAEKSSELTSTKSKLNQITKIDDIVFELKDGVITKMNEDKKLSNGSVVDVNGIITKKDGKKVEMKNGDSIPVN